MSDNVLVVNFGKGIPSCMIERAFVQLNAFRELRKQGTFYANMIATRSNPKDAFRSATFDPVEKKTLFKSFNECGYRTELLGWFGMHDKLNKTDDHVWNAKKELEEWGINFFEAEDSFYRRSLGSLKDEEVVEKAIRKIEAWSSKNFLFLNCDGCADVEILSDAKRRTSLPEFPVVSIFSKEDTFAFKFEKEIISEQPYSRIDDVTKVLPPSTAAQESSIEAIRAESLQRFLGLKEERRTDEFVLKAHAFAWQCLLRWNAHLTKLIDALIQSGKWKNTTFVVCGTCGLGIEEHGTMRGMPWESSLRSFMLLHSCRQKVEERVSDSVSLQHFGTILMNYCEMNKSWNGKSTAFLPTPFSPSFTLQLDAFPLVRCKLVNKNVLDFKTFSVRVKFFEERWFAATVWFSLHDLGQATFFEWDTLEDSAKIRFLKEKNKFSFPESTELQVFDHMTDSDELVDLSAETGTFSKSIVAIATKYMKDYFKNGIALENISFISSCHEGEVDATCEKADDPLSAFNAGLRYAIQEGSKKYSLFTMTCMDGAHWFTCDGTMSSTWRGAFTLPQGINVKCTGTSIFFNGKKVFKEERLPDYNCVILHVEQDLKSSRGSVKAKELSKR